MESCDGASCPLNAYPFVLPALFEQFIADVQIELDLKDMTIDLSRIAFSFDGNFDTSELSVQLGALNIDLSSANYDDKIFTVGERAIVFGGGGNDILAAKSDLSLLASGEGNDVVLSKGNKTLISSSSGDDLIYAFGSLNVVISGEGNDQISSSGNGSFVCAGNGNDNLDITGLGGIYNVGDGDDSFTVRGGLLRKGGLLSQLNGGGGNDVYSIEGDSFEVANVFQVTYINNNGDTSTVDKVVFGGISHATSLSFQRLNNSDLAIGVLGTNRHIVLQKWYTDTSARVDSFQIANGPSLTQAGVQGLVNAWQDFQNGVLSQTELNASVQSAWA